MPDRPSIDVVDVHELRRKVCWLFYGTRNYTDLDEDAQGVVDDLVNDGYERFLSPLPVPGEKESHRWGFLRPYITITTVADQDDYPLPTDFGGLDGPIMYREGDSKYFPIKKTDPSRIRYLRQREDLSHLGYPTECAVVGRVPTGVSGNQAELMLWPTPDAAYNLDIRYYIITGKLSDARPYPACDAYHNQTLLESCLAVAEERLEDQRAIHAQNFLERMIASVSYDREKYGSDHMWNDGHAYEDVFYNDRLGNNYVTYTGYTHRWE